MKTSKDEILIFSTLEKLLDGTSAQDLSRRLERNMRDMSMSNRDLAKRSGIDSILVNSYLIGKRTPSKANLLKLANALDIPVEALQQTNIGSGREIVDVTIDTGKIKELAKKKGLNQRTLALVSGLTESSISKYMSGARHPSLGSLEKLANALDVDITELLKKDIPPSFKDSTMNLIEQLIIRYRDMMSDEDKSKLMRLIMFSK